MGFLADGIKRSIKRNKSYAPDDDYWYYPVGAPTASGIKIDEATAIKYLTVTACVSLIASDIAKLPLNLYKKRPDGGKDAIIDNHLYDLLHNAPNPETTSLNWRETKQAHLLTNGNAYSYIDRESGTGKIKYLWQLANPDEVKVSRRKSDGVITYTYKNQNGDEVTRTRDQIFHIPGFGFNGLVGMSMISAAREAIGLGVAAETYGGLFFSQGTHPSGTFETEQSLGDNAEEFAENLRKQYSSLGKSHRAMILQRGMKYKPITIPMDDAQFLATRNFQKLEICGLYHVPPHKIAIHGANSNNNNLEQENGTYLSQCLMAWITRWEANISLQLLTPAERKQGYFFEFVMQGLLRGDSQARAEYYNKLFQVGGITPNRIRALENDNPVEGGDESFVMMNMIPLSQAKDFSIEEDKKQENEPENDTKQEKKGLFKSFFGEDRARKASESKSIYNRDRISKIYAPLIMDAAMAIVNRESKAIKKKIESTQRAGVSMEAFLDDFYRTFPEYINKKMGPVLRSYMTSVIDATNKELNIDGENFDTEIKDYIDTYAKRHISSSKGQMNSLIESGNDAIATRADEWQERRPEKITEDERVRASSFAFQLVAFGVGMSTVWRIRGKTCPYCTSLSGKRVSRGQSFVKDGDEIDPEGGTGPMKFTGIKAHPPLHQKCDCYLSII